METAKDNPLTKKQEPNRLASASPQSETWLTAVNCTPKK